MRFSKVRALTALFLIAYAGPLPLSATISVAPMAGKLNVAMSKSESGGILRLEGADNPGADVWAPLFATSRNFTTVLLESDSLERLKFFRAATTLPPSIPAHAAWSHEVTLWNDPLRSEPEYIELPDSLEALEFSYIKFTILTDDLTRVYFQNSRDYVFHYEFAAAHLTPFAGLSRVEYDAATLREANRKAYLGAVLLAPQASEFGIEFVGQDTIPRETVAYLYTLVRSALTVPEGVHGYYLPTAEQQAEADAGAEYLAARGIEISAMDRWVIHNQVYSEGYAIGRLVQVAGDAIDAAYADGTLRADDILLTDRVPAEVPVVRGVVALEPATPNSHVAILLSAANLPFGYIEDPAQAEAVKSLDHFQLKLPHSWHF